MGCEINNLRILLFMPVFFNYRGILSEELESRGAVVDFVENKLQKFDYSSPTAQCRIFRILYHKMMSVKWRYAKKNIDWTGKYDIFICVNGFSFDKRIIKRLKKNNSSIKSILYLWDSSQMFSWPDIERYFDKSFSFDPIDAKRKGIEYLANFYPKLPPQKTEKRIDLFFVGTQHADRFDVISKIIPQTKSGSNIYVKLLIKYRNIFHHGLVYKLMKILNTNYSKYYILNYELIEKKINQSFLTYEPIDFQTIIKKMWNSLCVLDIQAPTQVGLSHQMVLALAMGKKIITTNKWIVNYDFYNQEQFLIIDRENPIIDITFLSHNSLLKETKIISSRIDRWVDKVLQ